MGRRSDWHERRATAQRHRFDRVRRCEGSQLVRSCQSCGVAKTIRLSCESRWFCGRCRAKAQRRDRAKVGRALRGLGELHRDELRRGDLGFRLVTLTTPSAGLLDDRVRALGRARRKFHRRLETYAEVEHGTSRPHWVSRPELTPGSTKRGHVHAHEVVLSPYLPSEVLGVLWAECLRSSGCPGPVAMRSTDELLESAERRGGARQREQVERWLRRRRGFQGALPSSVPWVHVDVRRTTADEAATELAKYVTKHVTKGVADLEFHAAAFAALDGRRLLSSSMLPVADGRRRGLFAYFAPERDGGCECGCTFFEVHVEPATNNAEPRGPPYAKQTAKQTA